MIGDDADMDFKNEDKYWHDEFIEGSDDLKLLIELVKFFDIYPLISRKKGDYILFKKIISIIQMRSGNLIL